MEMKEIGPGRGMPNFDLPMHTLRVEEILQKRVGGFLYILKSWIEVLYSWKDALWNPSTRNFHY